MTALHTYDEFVAELGWPRLPAERRMYRSHQGTTARVTDTGRVHITAPGIAEAFLPIGRPAIAYAHAVDAMLAGTPDDSARRLHQAQEIAGRLRDLSDGGSGDYLAYLRGLDELIEVLTTPTGTAS